MKKRSTLALIFAVLSIVCCSTSAILVRYSTAPSLVLAAYRKTIVTIMMLPFALTKNRKEIASLGIKNLAICTLSGIFLAIHFFTYFEAVQNTTVSAAQILTSTEVLFITLFMFVSGREKYKGLPLAGIILTLIGGIVVAWTNRTESGVSVSYGNIMAVIAALMLASYSFIGSKVRRTCSNTSYTFVVYGVSAVILNIMVLFSDYSFSGYGAVNYLTALGMAIFASLLGHSVLNWAVKYISPTLISMVRVLQPVFGTIWAIILFSEFPAPNQIIGGVIIIVGILIYTKTQARRNEKTA